MQKLLGQGSSGRAVAIDREWAFANQVAFRRAGERWMTVQNDVGGTTLAKNGPTLTGGLPTADVDGIDEAGAVRIYRLDPTIDRWVHTQTLIAGNPSERAHFGASVAFDGARILVGAPLESDPDLAVGAAYVFEFIDGAWRQTQRLASPARPHRGRFGSGLDIDGDRLAIGAPGANSTWGAVYVYEFDGSEWRHASTFDQGPNAFDMAEFGTAIDLDGDRCVVGAHNWGNDDTDNGVGNVFYYERCGGQWCLLDDMRGFYGWQGDWVGYSVQLQGDVIFAGRPRYDHNREDDFADSGALDVIDIVGGQLQPRVRLEPVDADGPRLLDWFGTSVAVDGDLLLVGAPGDDEAGTNAGAAYVFSIAEQCPHVATLIDLRMLEGRVFSGGLAELETSDDSYLETEARVTGEAHQPQILRMRLAADTDLESPTNVVITIEGRITDVEAQTTLLLRDWVNGGFVQVDQYAMGQQEEVHETVVGDAGRFFRASDGLMRLEIRQVVFLPVIVAPFHTLFDHIEIAVR